MEISGELVKLRAFREADAEPMAEALRDPAVTQWLDSWAWGPYSLYDAQEFIRQRGPDTTTWAIECVEDGALIGSTGLHALDFRNRHCQWGIWIGPPTRWGKGYGTEACRLSVRYAFQALGMEKVYLYVYEGNERGRRTYEKAGFQVEGTLPRHHWHLGRLITAYLMAAYRDHPLYSPS
jgi:RimJ/RimL family protein N-acetyltransferase